MQESGENYLETIYLLSLRGGVVRSIDVAAELCFAKPSVSRAVGVLKKQGLLETDKTGALLLTDAGLARAQAIYFRHRTIARCLIEILGVCPEVAEHDACRIEHVVSEETIEKMALALKGGV